MTSWRESQREPRPRWTVLVGTTVAAGLLFLPLTREGVALYFYAFPLFGVGITYVLQFRRLITLRWWITFAAITPLSSIALALDWAFSGHILWNVLFLAHERQRVRSRPWALVLLASLGHLVVLKALFQRPKDVLGIPVSLAVALAIVVVLRTVERDRSESVERRA